MTENHDNSEERRALTREIAAVLLEDLAHMRAVLARPEPSRAEFRNLSATLRRILVADRDLTAVAAPRIGRI
jgi:hypothetical protein